MKGMKKLLSILMVLTLVLSLGASAFAVTVTIDSKLNGHTFTAYQIFKGTQNDESGNALADVQWGNDIDAEKFVGGLKEIDSDRFKDCVATDPNSVVKALNGADETLAKKVAEVALDSLKEDAAGKAFDEKTTLDSGYYLIKDTTEGLTGENAVYNDVVLQVTQDVTINYKTNVPSSEKKVKDINDSTETEQSDWQDSADWDIGDDVPFQITGTLPANYADYDTYAITFHDEQSAGLTFKSDSVKVYYEEGESRTEVTNGFKVKTSGTHAADCTFEVVFDDVKTIQGADGVIPTNAGGKIVIEYNSQLNPSAKIGWEGNPNEMYMDFSNNPHGDGTGQTPKNKVKVFTFRFEANKVEPDGASTKPLEGAGFTLLKKVADGGETKKYNEGTPFETSYDNVIEVKKYDVQAGVTEFKFEGLDDGEYILVESTVPAGYNKADDIEFTITATHDSEATDPQLLTFSAVSKEEPAPTISVNESGTEIKGEIEINVVNNKGVELPETGGIGTTIFYIAGAILVAGAVIILVTKKRVSGAEK